MGRRRKRARGELADYGHSRPVTGLMDSLSHLSLAELHKEKERLERARDQKGIGPEDWYRLQAVRALLAQHEIERTRRAIWEMDTDPSRQS